MFIVDRFEGEWAVIEYQDKTFNFPKELLPKSAKEGDILKFNVDVDKQSSKKAQEGMQKMLDDMFEKE